MNLMQTILAMSMTAAITLVPTAQARGQGDAVQAAVPDTLFVIDYRPGPAWRPGLPHAKQNLRDHFYYMKALDEAGRIVIAGAAGSDGGLIVARAHDLAEAERIIHDDPATVAGVFVGTARAFEPRFVTRTLPVPVPMPAKR